MAYTGFYLNELVLYASDNPVIVTLIGVAIYSILGIIIYIFLYPKGKIYGENERNNHNLNKTNGGGI